MTAVSNSGAVFGSFQDQGGGVFHISVPISVSFDVATGGGETAHFHLAGALNATGSFCYAGVDGGVLTATNTGPAATMTLSHSGSTTSICGYNFADSSYSSVVINTGAGNDTVNIENTLGGKPVTVNEGNGNVTLNVSPSAHNLTNIQGGVMLHAGGGTDYLYVNDQSITTPQTFTMGANSVTRGGVAVISYNIGINYVTINGGNGANTYNVLGTESFYHTILNTGNGHDTVKVDGTGFGGTFTINDGTGGVDVTLGATTHNLNNLHGTVNVNGGQMGLDTLTVDDQANGSSRTFTLADHLITSTGVDIHYDNRVDRLTVSTGIGGATVNVLATSTLTFIVGHASGMVNVGDAGNIQGLQAPLYISDPPADAYVTINVDDSADSAYQNLTLNRNGDVYYIMDPVAYIGYDPVDTASVNIWTGPGGADVYVDDTAKPVNLMGHPTAPVSLFASNGFSAPDAWTIMNQNSGTLSSPRIAGPVTFSGVSNLHGGEGDNTFTFADNASLTGAIVGGSGTNALDYSAYSSSVLVDLQTGYATGVFGGVTRIQNVIGGSTGGGPGIYNILVGNGNNVLTGGNGRRNLLIAGATASTLIGGNDDDILVGGTTAYDTEAGLVSLQAIMDYWSTTADDYGTRVSNLLSGNGVPLLDATMVFNNGGSNTLTGNQGGPSELNLFYGLDPALETTDYNSVIGEQFINC
jgi:hypothetical protein